ncbi:hypothetical protein K503DRAFT_130165, partial [Rhizopogon vinicolor AM-OR11-026]
MPNMRMNFTNLVTPDVRRLRNSEGENGLLYILSKQWGVELFHEGSQLESHYNRFSSTDSYGINNIPLSDYISLDCRVTVHAESYPCNLLSFSITILLTFTSASYVGLPNLDHAVFQDGYKKGTHLRPYVEIGSRRGV